MEGEEHFGTGTICEIFKQSGYSPHSMLLFKQLCKYWGNSAFGQL